MKFELGDSTFKTVPISKAFWHVYSVKSQSTIDILLFYHRWYDTLKGNFKPIFPFNYVSTINFVCYYELFKVSILILFTRGTRRKSMQTVWHYCE